MKITFKPQNSLATRRSLGVAQKGSSSALERLSSGKRINRASDDAAGLAIAMDLLADSSASRVAYRNQQDGISAISVTDGTLSQVGDTLSRMKELAIQARNGTLNDTQRSNLNKEYQELAAEINRQTEVTEFNGVKTLDGEDLNIQAGTETDGNGQITVEGVSTQELDSLLSTSIDTVDNAGSALGDLDAALQSVSSTRASLGASYSRLESAGRNTLSKIENQEAARSRIEDADIAQEAANKLKFDILTQAGTAILAQANQKAENVLALLG